MPQNLTKENFNEVIINANVPVLVDFWAPWCAPCRTLNPILERVEKLLDGQAIVCKVNVDEQPELAGQFGVRGIPMVLAFDKEQILGELVGVQPEVKYIELLGFEIG